MNVKSIVVEQLDWNGTTKSLSLESENGKQLWVAFPTDYEEQRNGPFYFQNSRYEQKYNEGFAECKARKVGKNNFYNLNEVYTYKTNWHNIPTEENSVSYYALYLPENAIPINVKVFDSFKKDKEFKRTIFKDEQKPRYIIYLQCSSKFGKFSFNLECSFKKDKLNFKNSSYSDEFQQDFYGQPEEWKYLLNEEERQKTQDFFATQIIINNGTLNQNINMKKNNPWISGLFYLFVAIVVITGLSVISKTVDWKILPIIIIGGILLIGIIGAFQLKNDDKLNEDNFIGLMKETYKRLPFLKSFVK